MYESSNPHHIILLSSFKFLYMYILLSYMKDTLGSVHYIKKYINLELKLCNSINLYLSSTTTIWRVIIINNFIFCQKKNIQNKSCLLIVLFCWIRTNICMYALSNYYTIYPCFYMSFILIIYMYNVINVSEVLYSQFHTPPHYPPPPSFPPFVKRN